MVSNVTGVGADDDEVVGMVAGPVLVDAEDVGGRDVDVAADDGGAAFS